MANKYANMPFAQITQREAEILNKNRASGATWAVFAFLKMNFNTKNGMLATTIGDDAINYQTIANRLGYHRTIVRRSVQWLNRHQMVNTYLDKHLRGRVHNGSPSPKSQQNEKKK